MKNTIQPGSVQSWKSNLWLSWLLLVFALGLGAVLLEGTYRLYLRWDGRPVLGPVVPRDVGQFDKRLGWSLKPLSHGFSRRTGYEVEYRINSKGLRDDETTYKKPNGIFRIVLLGDSHTFGFGVPIEKHFSTILEGYFTNVEVINMGVSGLGIDQELLFLQLEGFHYEPDLVIVYVPHYGGHRHMHTERWSKSKPRFLLKEDQLILTNWPVPKLEPSVTSTVLDFMERHSAVYRVIRWGFIEKLRGTNSDMTPQTQQNRKNQANETFRKQLYDLGEAIVREMHKTSKEHEANFVVVTSIRELHSFCLKNGIFSLDVSKALSNPKFSLPDKLGHQNESGNGVLAWEIVKYLKTRKLVLASHQR